MNNPMKYVDPTGHYAVQDMWAKDIIIDEAQYKYNTEQDHIDYLKKSKDFTDKRTFEGNLQRYKLVPEYKLSLLRNEQKLAGLVPKMGNALKANLERNIWHLVDGNSVTPVDKVIEGVVGDLAMGVAGKYSNMSGYDKRLSNIGTAIQESENTYNLKQIAQLDRVSFDLMDQVGISIYGNNKNELTGRANFVYNFIEQNKNYFLKRQKSYGIEGYEELDVTKYQYQKMLYRTINRPTSNDPRLNLQTMKFSSVEAREEANNYQGIISDLRKQYWGYWDYENQSYIDGYYQYNLDHNYRVDPYYTE